MTSNTPTPSALQETLCGEIKKALEQTEVDCPIEFQEKELIKKIKLIGCIPSGTKKILIESPAYSMLSDDNFDATKRLVTLGYKLEVI